MNAASRCNNNSNSGFTAGGHLVRERTAAKHLLPALIALGGGCGIFGGTASALELGELQVHSTLGQPLRASVAYALQPSEQIHAYCIYLRSGVSASGLPSIRNAAISLGNGIIRVTGQSAIREPLVSLQLTVDCPSTAHLRRDYSVFLDLALPGHSPTAAAPLESRRAAAENERATPLLTERRAVARSAARTPVVSSGTYRVQAGDSLSAIAAGIPGRSVGIWQAAGELFAANPAAFIGNDMNLLRSGALLAIPDSILAPRGASPATTDTAFPPQADQARDESGTASTQPSIRTGVNEPAPVTATTTDGRAMPVEQAQTAQHTAVRQPGAGDPFLLPIEADPSAGASGISAPPPEALPQAMPQTSVRNAPPGPTVPVVRTDPGTTSGSWSWMIWLGGSGVALLIGLLLFGRRLKERFAPVGLQEVSDRHGMNRELDETDVSPMPGLPDEGTAPVARRLSLDADLDDGAGFGYGNDIDVAQDFGFSDSGSFDSRLDMDLTGAATSEVTDRTTNIISPQRMQEQSIIVSEMPFSHDDSDEYDVSMIVDATRQVPGDSDDSTKDLRAVQVDAEDDATGTGKCMLGQEVDYKILEQDYEEELTATQALNAEIARAARALSRQFGKNEIGDTLADTMSDAEDDGTELLSAADQLDVHDDATAAMPTAGAGMISSVEESEETAQMPSPAPALSLENTANDPTVEVESAAAATRKVRAS